jgi:parvulin-like peptidyl-prolyl isomerase
LRIHRATLAAAIIAAAAARAAAQTAPTLPAGVVATVNGQPISASRIEDRLWRGWGTVYTGYAIRRDVVRAEARKRGITVTPEEVQTAVTEYQTRFNSVSGRQPRDWELFIARFGRKNIEERQRDELFSTKIGDDEAKKAVLTPEEKQRVLDDLERAAHKVHVRHILVGYGAEYENRTEPAAKARAAEVQAKLAAGASWDDAAKEYSDDVATRATGGDLGFFTRDQVVKPLEDAAFASASDTQTIHVIAVPSGYDVFQVMEREDKPPTDADTQKAMDETLARKREIVKQPGYWYPIVAKQYKTVIELPYERP